MKPLFWVGSAKKDLLAMPAQVVDVVGYALHLAQSGHKHQQAKPLICVALFPEEIEKGH